MMVGWLSVLAGSDSAPADERTAESIRQAAQRDFAYASYLKPPLEGLEGRVREFAPLVVRELLADAEMPRIPPVFSGGCDVRVYWYPHWLERQGASLRQVYAQTDRSVWDGVEREQVTWIWVIEERQQATGNRQEPTGNRQQAIGIRITLGLDGFPVVWEVLDSREKLKVLYVSRSAEYAAQQEFGKPAAGRQWVMERPGEETAEVVVVRTLADGPVPMGPYAYVDAAGRITHVLCRCSPSQVGEFLREGEYDVRPMTELGEEVGAMLGPVDLTKVLRWPKGL